MTAGKGVIRDGGKFGVRLSGKFPLFNASGECPACCEPPPPPTCPCCQSQPDIRAVTWPVPGQCGFGCPPSEAGEDGCDYFDLFMSSFCAFFPHPGGVTPDLGNPSWQGMQHAPSDGPCTPSVSGDCIYEWACFGDCFSTPEKITRIRLHWDAASAVFYKVTIEYNVSSCGFSPIWETHYSRELPAGFSLLCSGGTIFGWVSVNRIVASDPDWPASICLRFGGVPS